MLNLENNYSRCSKCNFNMHVQTQAVGKSIRNCVLRSFGNGITSWSLHPATIGDAWRNSLHKFEFTIRTFYIRFKVFYHARLFPPWMKCWNIAEILINDKCLWTCVTIRARQREFVTCIFCGKNIWQMFFYLSMRIADE